MIILQDILFNQVLKDNLSTEELMDELISEYEEIFDLLDELERELPIR